MVMVQRLYEFDRLSSCGNGGSKVAALSLKLRRLERSVGYGDWSPQLVDVTLGAHRVLHLIREIDVCASPRKPDWLHVIHAAHTQSTFDDIRGNAEVLFPLR